MAVHKGVGHYGLPITLDQAKKVMVAAEAKARQNNWNVVISIVDSGGHAVMLQCLDGSHLAAIGIAEGKARTAVEFRRPTKALEDAMAGLWSLAPSIKQVEDGAAKGFPLVKGESGTGKESSIFRSAIRRMVRFLRRHGCSQGQALTLGGVAETFVALNRGPRVWAMEIWSRGRR